MFLSPYQTTPCKDYNLKAIVQELLLGKVEGMLLDRGDGIWLTTPSLSQVPIFTQPITRIEMDNRKDVPDVIIDGRTLLRHNRSGSGDEWTVSNLTEHEFQLMRAKLQKLWMQDSFDKLDLLRVGDLGAITFINWVCKSLSSKLGLDPQQYLNTTVIVGYYYASLHYEETQFDEDTKMKIAQQVSRWTRVPVINSLSIIDQLGYMETVRDLVDALKVHGGSMRLNQLNIGLIYALLGGSWFGNNSRETVAVSLEHPPTFTALMKAALELRSYKNAMLSKVASMQVRAGNDAEYLKNLNFLINKL